MLRPDAGEEELARERQRWEERWEELNVQRSVEEFEQYTLCEGNIEFGFHLKEFNVRHHYYRS